MQVAHRSTAQEITNMFDKFITWLMRGYPIQPTPKVPVSQPGAVSLVYVNTDPLPSPIPLADVPYIADAAMARDTVIDSMGLSIEQLQDALSEPVSYTDSAAITATVYDMQAYRNRP